MLERAVLTNADHLVTGDKRHLLPLGMFRGVSIVTPRALLEITPKTD